MLKLLPATVRLLKLNPGHECCQRQEMPRIICKSLSFRPSKYKQNYRTRCPLCLLRPATDRKTIEESSRKQNLTLTCAEHDAELWRYLYVPPEASIPTHRMLLYLWGCNYIYNTVAKTPWGKVTYRCPWSLVIITTACPWLSPHFTPWQRLH